jgi:AcrR family transcriptional regulator
MQEIADEAGANKMLLHYYFRSKERLFRRVVEEIIEQLITSVVKISVQAGTFREFLETFIDRHIDFLAENKDMVYFLLWEFRKDKKIIVDVVLKKFASMGGTPFDHITEKVRVAVAAQEIRPISPADLTLSLVSLDIFPLMIIPLIASIGELSDSQVAEMIQQRKEEAFRLLWNDIKQSAREVT